ncbi:CHAT domain-containing protein [Gluconacetobacter entanii]|uniref:CHAT domain-containing protein n=1 Tax=Gluconacetobacter entanii TaxID=108528 RepID=A0ABT3K199_9PROT|nr:CHAT domain-containing protein [Gluconacetobacter entanii]MCW4589182.1 CHAT domain-containing protein [Gluconacetobacter entanii]MCW4592722.1 CHAT domain-containing protein [Gluconacetobacter entanii]NPC88342.1 CHAT domain-containing protein [Gluconacetobacter entanii]
MQAPERGFILNVHKELNMSGQKQKKARCSVLIIDCQDKGEDPGSEGKFIRHMLNLMGVANRYHSVRTKTQFLELLSSVPTAADVVHIATHGCVEKPPNKKRKKFIGFWTPDEKHITMQEIASAGINLFGKTVVSTACLSGQKTPRKEFKEATKCKYYISPIKGPSFYNAALMCHIFYHKHLQLGRSVKQAFSEYENRYKNPHVFFLE